MSTEFSGVSFFMSTCASTIVAVDEILGFKPTVSHWENPTGWLEANTLHSVHVLKVLQLLRGSDSVSSLIQGVKIYQVNLWLLVVIKKCVLNEYLVI